MVQKILIVEDDSGVQEYLRGLLLDNGYSVETASDGLTALKLLEKGLADMVILDLGLPKLSGEAVCRDIRKRYPDMPIIILTGKDQSSDVVNGLHLGADDYVTKPFVGDVLLARIAARLRHGEGDTLKAADLTMNNKALEVFRGGKQITLSPHEFKLLQYMLNNKGRVLTREMILNRVWSYSYEVDSRVVDVYIGYLRRKIDLGYKKKLIQSVRGFGYVIKE